MRANLTVPSLVDALTAAIRERILTGQLTGGTPLTEKEISTFYDVARPTAKAALAVGEPAQLVQSQYRRRFARTPDRQIANTDHREIK